MKVVDLTELYSERGGGVRSHLSQKSLVARGLGVEHVVIAPGPRDEDTAAPERGRLVRIAGPPLPYDPTYHLMWRVDKVRARLRAERPDVLGIHSPYLGAAVALSVPRASFGVRVLTWHTDFIDTYLRVALERRLSASLASAALEPAWAAVRAIARRCDATFVASRWQQRKLAARGAPNVVYAPLGVDKRTFTPDRRSEAARARWLGPGRSSWHLLVGVGRLALEKRWDVVLDAFLRLRASERAVLVLFGDGPERGRLRARVAGRDDVFFAGFERDRGKLAEALASADALVHGCPYETYGLSLAEAASTGLPIVVPDEGGAAEIAGAASSETYASRDADDCARAITRLISRAQTGTLRRAALDAATCIPDGTVQLAVLFEHYRDLLRSHVTLDRATR